MDCIIIEDQAPAQRILKKYVADIGNLNLTGCFTNAITALDFMEQNEVELIFLDIHLPKISGMDFLKTLKNSPAVILTTAFPDYAVQSYEFDVVDYLVKPFSFERFVKAVTKARQYAGQGNDAQTDSGTDFFIKSGYEYIKIDSREILYIQSDMDYTEINLTDKKHLTQETLNSWEQKLGPSFIRVHRSYLVNSAKIQKVVGNQVYLSVEQSIPIGRAYKEDFFARFMQ